ncbi:MAG: TlpA family protein disulfide reductase [Bacteroidetes bacterium]|nr:TlpA family protein disulfide reductase [Bacteroidota bacterium]MBS1757819.1 TlpA family protein disulfide reductase [Bacteroidota bacterium]
MGIYRIRKITLQNDEKHKTSINLLNGISTNNKIIVIADANNNNNFSDDKVYYFNYDNSIKTACDLYNSAPIINIPNVTIYDDLKKEHSFSLQVKISPSIERNDGSLRSMRELTNIDNLDFDFYPINYYGESIIIDKVNYEVAVLPHPLAFEYYNLKAPGILNFNTIAFYEKKNKNLIDSQIFLYNLNAAIEYKKQFKVGNQFISVKDYSYKDNKITLYITKADELDSLNMIKELIKRNSLNKAMFENKDYILLEFSGSWCVPCKEVLPLVKDAFSKYKSKVAFITIDVERNKKGMDNFINESKLEWPIITEFLDCKSKEECLSNKLSVHSYPSFILINKYGKIIKQGVGEGTLLEIESIFKND